MPLYPIPSHFVKPTRPDVIDHAESTAEVSAAMRRATLEKHAPPDLPLVVVRPRWVRDDDAPLTGSAKTVRAELLALGHRVAVLRAGDAIELRSSAGVKAGWKGGRWLSGSVGTVPCRTMTELRRVLEQPPQPRADRGYCRVCGRPQPCDGSKHTKADKARAVALRAEAARR